MEKYFVWNKEISIGRYTRQRSFLNIEDKDRFMINKSGEDVLIAFNGLRTYDEAIDFLVEKYYDDRDNVIEVVEDYRKVLKDKYDLFLVETEKKDCSIEITGEECIYPKVASIEITEKCNIRCLHCYGEFSSNNEISMPIEKLKKLLTKLSEAGVQIIELTGGDISVYPDICEAIEWALRLPFLKIDLLTNGIALKDELINLIIENKDRIFVQIDIQSMKDEYLEWFCQKKISAKNVINNIEKLHKNSVWLRVATTVTSRNLDEVYEIADFVGKRKINWGVTSVEPLGRAAFDVAPEGLYLNEEETKKFSEILETVIKKYPDIIQLVDDNEKSNDNNCGVLSGHVVIKASGDVKLCTMDNLKYFNSSIGNVFDVDIKTIYDNNKEFIELINMQETPTFESEECIDCDKRYSCIGCLLRMFINIREKNFKCNWYNNKVNKKLVEKLLK